MMLRMCSPKNCLSTSTVVISLRLSPALTNHRPAERIKSALSVRLCPTFSAPRDAL